MRWSCDDCQRDGELRRRRGRCGGALHPALPSVRVADDGALEIPGGAVVGGARGGMQEARFRACPVALSRAPEVLDAMRTFRRRDGGHASSEPRPPRIERLVDVVAAEHDALAAWQLERWSLTPKGA